MKRVRPLLNRRDMLALMGAIATAKLVGCAGGRGGFEGPFFVDEKLNRSDLRVDPENGSVSPGVPLRLALHVFQIANNSCTPLRGATVDVWHCDALGSYSDVRENAGSAGDTRGRKFLHGYQVTDGQGTVEFQTIYPGWYQGRTVHLHFKIRTNPSSEVGHELTSQLYFDEAITDQVHAEPPYAQKGRRDTTNSSDGIFSRGGNDLMVALSKDTEGYSGTYKVTMLMT